MLSAACMLGRGTSSADMDSAVPSQSQVTCVMAPRLLALGEALAPVAETARRSLARRVRSSGAEFVVLDDLAHHTSVVQRSLSQLPPRLDGLMSDVIQNDHAGLIEVGRSAGRLEQVLSQLVDGFLELKASHAEPKHAEARQLMLSVYRHHIRDICEWLDKLVLIIINPTGEIHRRGIEPSEKIELTVSLDITIPPELTKLDALVKKLLPRPELGDDSSINCSQLPRKPPGLFGTIGALVFGLGASGVVLGSDDG